MQIKILFIQGVGKWYFIRVSHSNHEEGEGGKIRREVLCFYGFVIWCMSIICVVWGITGQRLCYSWENTSIMLSSIGSSKVCAPHGWSCTRWVANIVATLNKVILSLFLFFWCEDPMIVEREKIGSCDFCFLVSVLRLRLLFCGLNFWDRDSDQTDLALLWCCQVSCSQALYIKKLMTKKL